MIYIIMYINFEKYLFRNTNSALLYCKNYLNLFLDKIRQKSQNFYIITSIFRIFIYNFNKYFNI